MCLGTVHRFRSELLLELAHFVYTKTIENKPRIKQKNTTHFSSKYVK